MVIVQQVSKGIDIQGFAIIDTNNEESFLIQYWDFDLCMKTGRIIIMTQVWPKYGPCGFQFGPIIETYER